MYLQLRSIILWSHNSHFAPRVVPFEPGMVNVVMGGSRTGKSAVIPIMDYCLGASTCAIPKKVIRTACSWFGVVVETKDGQKLFARKNPGESEATGEMFVLEGEKIVIPHSITESNSTAISVKRKLDELCALSHLDFAGGDVVNALDYRPSFRDLMAFVFQPQNVVANRDVLFYRTETQVHREKLSRNILPYVLNAVSPEMLAAQHEVEHLNRELRRKQRDLERARAASSRWEAEMAGQLARARELGLTEQDTSSNLTQEDMLKLLRTVAQKTVEDFRADGSTITKAVEELVGLEAVEAKLAEELAELKTRQGELSRLREGAGGFRDALLLQRDRLSIAEWLTTQPTPQDGCPLCGGSSAPEREAIEGLRKNLTEVEATAGQLTELPAAVDREVQHLRRNIDNLVEKLAAVRRQKRTLGQTSKEARERQFQSLGVAHFLGQLGQALKLYDEVSEDGDLAGDIAVLKKKIATFEAQVNRAEIERRKEAAINRLSTYISQFMPQLDNDHPDDIARLVIDDLTLRITGVEGDSFLWNIGSGSNWLSYHLSAMLALQCFFLDQPYSSVPGLLVFDQPSQVYFPEKLIRQRNAPQETPAWTNDEDTHAVRIAFTLLGKIVEARKGALQIIVLDHAPETVWGHLSHVTGNVNWRTGDKLVPADWPGAED